MRFFLGVDLGGTKTHLAIADESGQLVGFGEGGPGNHQSVGYERMYAALYSSLRQALGQAQISPEQITSAAFGIAGYDWDSERPRTEAVISRLGLTMPYQIVNDAIPGLVAGARDGWGVVVISGTGCNCRGWDKTRQREGRVTGFGIQMGESAGASELVFRAMQLVGYSWCKRLPPTKLSDVFIEHTGAKDLEDLLRGYTEFQYHPDADLAPKIFDIAQQGDQVANDLIHWAGCELGELTNAVIRQLDFEPLTFDVVLSGSMFEGGKLLTEPMQETIHAVAPGAQFVRLTDPPVSGSVLIAMSAVGIDPAQEVRAKLVQTIRQYQINHS